VLGGENCVAPVGKYLGGSLSREVSPFDIFECPECKTNLEFDALKAFAAIGGTPIIGNSRTRISEQAIELSIFPVQNCIKQKYEGEEKQFEDGPP
jgi:hypothetical protein